MTKRELLEKAAKAAGMDWLIWTPGLAPIVPAGHRAHPERVCWNPLDDDGDALLLAVKLHLEITHNHPLDNDAWVMATPNGQMVGPTEEVDGEENRCAATRRCITRAAAAIGEGKSHG